MYDTNSKHKRTIRNIIHYVYKPFFSVDILVHPDTASGLHDFECGLRERLGDGDALECDPLLEERRFRALRAGGEKRGGGALISNTVTCLERAARPEVAAGARLDTKEVMLACTCPAKLERDGARCAPPLVRKDRLSPIKYV